MYNKSLQDVPQDEHAGEGEGGGDHVGTQSVNSFMGI